MKTVSKYRTDELAGIVAIDGEGRPVEAPGAAKKTQKELNCIMGEHSSPLRNVR